MADHDSNPTPGSAAQPAKRGRLPIILLVIIAVIVLTGAIGAVVLYDRATAIDRSTPAAVARQFLHAAINEEDANHVGLFICRSWSVHEALAAARVEGGDEAYARWAIGDVRFLGQREAEVSVRVEVAVASGGVSAELTEVWVLDAVEDDGWRICSIRRASLEP